MKDNIMFDRKLDVGEVVYRNGLVRRLLRTFSFKKPCVKKSRCSVCKCLGACVVEAGSLKCVCISCMLLADRGFKDENKD